MTSTNSGSRTDGGLALGVDERAAPGFAVEQSFPYRVGGAAVVKVGGYQQAAGPQQIAQSRMQCRDRSVAIKKSDVIAGIETGQHGGEVALVDGDAVIQSRRRDMFTGERHMLGIALDAVHHGIRGAVRERQRGVTERRPQFQNAARWHRAGQCRKQETVVIGISAAAMPGAMPVRGLADFRKRVGRRFPHGRYSRLG